MLLYNCTRPLISYRYPPPSASGDCANLVMWNVKCVTLFITFPTHTESKARRQQTCSFRISILFSVLMTPVSFVLFCLSL